jgi:hypothetical protein
MFEALATFLKSQLKDAVDRCDEHVQVIAGNAIHCVCCCEVLDHLQLLVDAFIVCFYDQVHYDAGEVVRIHLWSLF